MLNFLKILGIVMGCTLVLTLTQPQKSDEVDMTKVTPIPNLSCYNMSIDLSVEDKHIAAWEKQKEQERIALEEAEKLAALEEVTLVLSAEPVQESNYYSYNYNYSDYNYSGDVSDPKEWIAYRESTCNYDAVSSSGRYIGRYQIDYTYFDGRYGGDGSYSPENQEIVADNYVAEVYGSWENAQSFWSNNGWY